eukprot:10712981-Heterocapsa_arctica.AAC.1
MGGTGARPAWPVQSRPVQTAAAGSCGRWTRRCASNSGAALQCDAEPHVPGQRDGVERHGEAVEL